MKKDIRSTILKKRSSMPLSEVLEKSKLIKEQVVHMEEFKEAKTILFMFLMIMKYILMR